MAATISEYLVKSASIKGGSADFKKKLRVVGDMFTSLEGLKSASTSRINSAKNLEGQPLIRKFTPKETAIFRAVQKEIDASKSIEENFIVLLTTNFINKQLAMLNELSLDSINTNPLLCTALKMETAYDLVRYNVYAAATRSIVTSMGYLIEDLLFYSNDDVYDGKDFSEGDSNKWDLVLERLGSVRVYLEVKSGPNDIDKTQMKSYAREILAVEKKGYKGRIGISYGRKDSETVTTGLLKTYLKDWEEHTLIGTELWDYVSCNPNYHILLMSVIKNTASITLKRRSIVKLIEMKIKVITAAFLTRYPSIEDYYSQLW